MTTSTRSGRQPAGRAAVPLRRTTTAHSPAAKAPVRATPGPAQRPSHHEQPSWEELLGRR